MIALINFCVLKYNIDPERAREDTESIVELAAKCASFKGKKIVRELRKLFKANYWTKLEKKNQLGVFKKRKLEAVSVESANEAMPEGIAEIIGSLLEDPSLSVQEITEEGWLLTLPHKHREQQKRTMLLKVPQKLKILGKVGMSFSGMGLRNRNGIWQPFGTYLDSEVCDGVYQ
jgi:polyphosphate kinase